ncbi:MAG TPA: cytochrome c [Vicinamibacterales bacterium]|nr:cytochrome c [Vicinamibacterales bacterium]
MRGRSSTALIWLFMLMLGLAGPATVMLRAESLPPLSPEEKAGKQVFQANCTLCHVADSTDLKIGPGLKGILKNKLLPDGETPATVDNVRKVIEKGIPDATPMAMPALGSKLSKTEIDNLIAYLKTL